MKLIRNKLTSRKLWAAVLGLLTGIGIAFGVEGDTITTCAGAITALCSVVSYILAEGRIDASRINAAVEAAQMLGDALCEPEEEDANERGARY